jgi:hypothetical protein
MGERVGGNGGGRGASIIVQVEHVIRRYMHLYRISGCDVVFSYLYCVASNLTDLNFNNVHGFNRFLTCSRLFQYKLEQFTESNGAATGDTKDAALIKVC